MPAPTRIVDSHQHVRWHKRDEHALVADLDAHAIDYAWLLTWSLGPAEQSPEHAAYLNPALTLPNGSHPGIPLGELLLAREKYPRRFLVGFCPNPVWPSAPALLESAFHMHDVRICGEWKFRLNFDDPRSLAIFAMAGKLKIPVVLHLDVPWLPHPKTGARTFQPAWYGGTVERLECALQACPETVFIGHAPGFWREITGDADQGPDHYPRGPVTPGGRLYRLFDTYPNLFADLSAGSGRNALARDPQHAAEFLTRYADRLLFGRDYYERELHDFLQGLPLSADVVEKIYWKNAERLVPAPQK